MDGRGQVARSLEERDRRALRDLLVEPGERLVLGVGAREGQHVRERLRARPQERDDADGAQRDASAGRQLLEHALQQEGGGQHEERTQRHQVARIAHLRAGQHEDVREDPGRDEQRRHARAHARSARERDRGQRHGAERAGDPQGVRHRHRHVHEREVREAVAGAGEDQPVALLAVLEDLGHGLLPERVGMHERVGRDEQEPRRAADREGEQRDADAAQARSERHLRDRRSARAGRGRERRQHGRRSERQRRQLGADRETRGGARRGERTGRPALRRADREPHGGHAPEREARVRRREARLVGEQRTDGRPQRRPQPDAASERQAPEPRDQRDRPHRVEHGHPARDQVAVRDVAPRPGRGLAADLEQTRDARQPLGPVERVQRVRAPAEERRPAPARLQVAAGPVHLLGDADRAALAAVVRLEVVVVGQAPVDPDRRERQPDQQGEEQQRRASARGGLSFRLGHCRKATRNARRSIARIGARIGSREHPSGRDRRSKARPVRTGAEE